MEEGFSIFEDRSMNVAEAVANYQSEQIADVSLAEAGKL